jgi:hypothetical protein
MSQKINATVGFYAEVVPVGAEPVDRIVAAPTYRQRGSQCKGTWGDKDGFRVLHECSGYHTRQRTGGGL